MGTAALADVSVVIGLVSPRTGPPATSAFLLLLLRLVDPPARRRGTVLSTANDAGAFAEPDASRICPDRRRLADQGARAGRTLYGSR